MTSQLGRMKASEVKLKTAVDDQKLDDFTMMDIRNTRSVSDIIFEGRLIDHITVKLHSSFQLNAVFTPATA